jgi:hypothetical protein
LLLSLNSIVEMPGRNKTLLSLFFCVADHMGPVEKVQWGKVGGGKVSLLVAHSLESVSKVVLFCVIPAKAGIHPLRHKGVGARLRGHDRPFPSFGTDSEG